MLFAAAFVLAIVGVVVIFVGTILGSFGSANVLSSALNASGYNFCVAIVIGAIVGQTVPRSLAERLSAVTTGRAWPSIVAAAYLIASTLAPVIIFVALMRAEFLARSR